MNASHSIDTPRGVSGAIAMIRLRSDDLDATLESIGIERVESRGVQLRSMLGIDTGVVASWDDGSVMLMPHGGTAIVRALSEALSERGVPMLDDDQDAFPEAKDEHESRMLAALSRAASPLAMDLLLDQPRRWRSESDEELADADVLQRLIDPPIVVAIGDANIGKSSLLNAIAGRHVALVADMHGTTRDHVGVSVDLAGLVVHWVDTPGIDEHADDESVAIATGVLERADLVIHCMDAEHGEMDMDSRLQAAIAPRTPIVRAWTRADRVAVDSLDDRGIPTSSATGAGIEDLVMGVREQLVPTSVLEDPRPWRFWTD